MLMIESDLDRCPTAVDPVYAQSAPNQMGGMIGQNQ